MNNVINAMDPPKDLALNLSEVHRAISALNGNVVGLVSFDEPFACRGCEGCRGCRGCRGCEGCRGCHESPE